MSSCTWLAHGVFKHATEQHGEPLPTKAAKGKTSSDKGATAGKRGRENESEDEEEVEEVLDSTIGEKIKAVVARRGTLAECLKCIMKACCQPKVKI